MKKEVPFSDRLSGLCAMELSAAHGNADRIGEMIERLINSMAFTIAVATKGDQKAMSDMIEGATAYLYEAAASHQKAGNFLGR